jgi:tetratricopeptide (TPR) repeat protein
MEATIMHARTASAAVLAVFVFGCAPSVETLREMGIHRYRTKQNYQSMAYLREALEKNPNDAQCNYYMGLNYRQIAERQFLRGNPPAAAKACDTAIFYYTQAVKSWPNYMEAVRAKNEALEARGNYEKALDTAAYVASNNRGTSALHFVYLADEYTERGDYDNAAKNYKVALANDPNCAKAYAGMGRMYLLAGDKDLGIDSLRRAYELNPAEPGVADLLTQHSVEPLNSPTEELRTVSNEGPQ